MAQLELLPIAATDATSADLTVEAGTPVTVCIKGDEINAVVTVKVKDDAGAYWQIGYLANRGDRNAITISGPGTYRFHRPAGKACGVFRA